MKVVVRSEEIIIPELEESEPPIRYWTEREEAILRKYYGKADTKKIAEYLGRTIRAVKHKVINMGLRYGGE